MLLFGDLVNFYFFNSLTFNVPRVAINGSAILDNFWKGAGPISANWRGIRHTRQAKKQSI